MRVEGAGGLGGVSSTRAEGAGGLGGVSSTRVEGQLPRRTRTAGSSSACRRPAAAPAPRWRSAPSRTGFSLSPGATSSAGASWCRGSWPRPTLCASRGGARRRRAPRRRRPARGEPIFCTPRCTRRTCRRPLGRIRPRTRHRAGRRSLSRIRTDGCCSTRAEETLFISTPAATFVARSLASLDASAARVRVEAPADEGRFLVHAPAARGERERFELEARFVADRAAEAVVAPCVALEEFPRARDRDGLGPVFDGFAVQRDLCANHRSTPVEELSRCRSTYARRGTQPLPLDARRG